MSTDDAPILRTDWHALNKRADEAIKEAAELRDELKAVTSERDLWERQARRLMTERDEARALLIGARERIKQLEGLNV